MTAPLPLAEHPLRQRLNDEVHARPPMVLGAEEWISYLAVVHEGTGREAEEAHLHRLCDALGARLCPVIHGDHWVMEAGDLRLKWERHNEFSGYTFFLARRPEHGPDTTALEALPADWLAAIPGSLMVATHLEFRPAREGALDAALASLSRESDTVVAAAVADGAAWVLSDFRLKDGFSRYLVLDRHLQHRQAGRTVQRLLEIETYRVMALLAFPMAKEVGRFLAQSEEELAQLMDGMGDTTSTEEERQLLNRLTRLAAEVERSVSRSAYRFGAAEAYYALVQQRIHDLREQRVDGYPPIKEFMERRLAPAINTCLSIARRQNDLSTRIARKSALLRTRVDIELEKQNQLLLAQMNRRSRLQLRLQETVEGLSVVAITYYASQLVTYLAKGLKAATGNGLEPEIVTAVAIPVIAATVFWGMARMRKALAASEDHGEH